MMNIPLASNFVDVGAHVHHKGGITVREITVTQLSQGSGASKTIERGDSIVVTRGVKPPALLRPYCESDTGEEVSAEVLYAQARQLAKLACQGKPVIMTRRGEPFATLCKPPPKFRVENEAELAEAIRVLRVTSGHPTEHCIELLKLGAALAEEGKLKWSIALLEHLKGS